MDLPTQPVFDALADATRRRILALLLAEGELCVCELTAGLALGQPKISRHLAMLKDAGLVTARREGTWMHYRRAQPLPDWLTTLLEALRGGAVTELAADRTRLQGFHNRPARCAA